MEDAEIIELYWARSERAISETAEKYGRYCYSIAYGILQDRQDSDECVNETYLNTWKSIPPHHPDKLSAFLGKITRNLALNRWRCAHTQKRGAGQIPLILDELQDVLPSSDSMEYWTDTLALREALDRFLASLSKEKRLIFMRRYWYLNSVKEIASYYSISESKVKMSLLRSRTALQKMLQNEGIL